MLQPFIGQSYSYSQFAVVSTSIFENVGAGIEQTETYITELVAFEGTAAFNAVEVPEPNSLALFATMIFGLVIRKRITIQKSSRCG